jgi:glycosyltransferase involved in cell wall biosynthesis
MTSSLCFVLITFNEEHNLRGCLDLLRAWSDDIVVLDSYSSDKTIDIALEFGARVYQRKFDGFGNQWNYAISHCDITSEFIMKVDPDERPTIELLREIRNAIDQSSFNGFYVPIRLFFMGHKLPHSLKLIRLWRNGYGRFSNVIANEHLMVDGEVSLLKNEIEHHDSPDLDHWFQKQNKYTTSEAEQRYFDNYLSFPPSFFRGRIQRRMWLKKYFYSIPFRYSFYFLYLYIYLGTWRLGRVGYIWSRLRVDVFRFIEYKQYEMILLKGPYSSRSSQLGSPDSRAIQL